jgi:hypothetical protein
MGPACAPWHSSRPAPARTSRPSKRRGRPPRWAQITDAEDVDEDEEDDDVEYINLGDKLVGVLAC